MFIPLQVVAFATLPAPLRTDGTALLSLFRNVGSAIGISITSAMLAHNTQVLHSEIGAFVTPFNRAAAGGRRGRRACSTRRRRWARRCWMRW